MPRPNSSMWRIVTYQGLTLTVDSDTLAAEDAREAPRQ